MLRCYFVSSPNLQQIHKIYPTLNNTSDHGLSNPFKDPEEVANGLRGKKILWWSVVSYSIGNEFTAGFKCLHRRRSEGLKSGKREGCTSRNKYVRTYVHTYFPSEKLIPEGWPRILDTFCVNYTKQESWFLNAFLVHWTLNRKSFRHKRNVNEGKKGRMERRGRRRKRLLDEPRETRRHWKLKEEALDRTVWRTRFARRLWTFHTTDYILIMFDSFFQIPWQELILTLKLNIFQMKFLNSEWSLSLV